MGVVETLPHAGVCPGEVVGESSVHQHPDVVLETPSGAGACSGEEAIESRVNQHAAVSPDTSVVAGVCPTEDVVGSSVDQHTAVVLETPTVAGVYPGDTAATKAAPAVLSYEDDNEVPIVHPITTQGSEPKIPSNDRTVQPRKQPKAKSKTPPKIKPKPNKVAPSNGATKSRDTSRVRSNKVAPESGKTSERPDDVEHIKAASAVPPVDTVPCDSGVHTEEPSVFTISTDGITNPGYIAAPEEDIGSGEKLNDDTVNETNV